MQQLHRLMNLRRYAHLVALAEERNFRKAAERVHLSQPALTRSVQAAEAELGLALFERGSGEIRCTPAGEFVVERARRLLLESRRLEREVGMYREREMGDVAFGAGPFPAATLLPALMQELRTAYPGIRSRVLVANYRYLIDHLRKEDLDFFVADTREVTGDATFSVTPIARQRGGFYARRGHPLDRPAAASLAEVMDHGLATGRLPGPAADTLRGVLGLGPDDPLPVAVDCDDTHLIKRITCTSDTVMVGSPGIVRDELAAGQLVEIFVEGLPAMHAEVGIVALRGRTPSPMAGFVSRRLTELAAQASD
jgi:DNA-binding transcriptional LysR family regulator